jgi:NAD(P)-dependent dehydrogenase (short-subunit alcohol dehydrogenase family)
VDEAAAEGAARAIDPTGQRVNALAAALDQEREAARVIEAVVERWGRLDVLVNNAGVRVYGPVTEATQESWEYVLGVNLLAVAYCAKYAIPQMAGNGGGCIVNVSSVQAFKGRHDMPQYAATKAGVLALTRSLAYAHADQGIRVNAICPGPTLTPFHVRRRAERDAISLEAAEAALRAEGSPWTLLKRQADPREIAYAILFLANAESSFITGTTLTVDGGLMV